MEPKREDKLIYALFGFTIAVAFVLATYSNAAGVGILRLMEVENESKNASVTTDTTLLSANPNRHSWCVRTLSTATQIVYISKSATATTSSMPFEAGESYCDGGPVVYAGEVSALSADTTDAQTVYYWED